MGLRQRHANKLRITDVHSSWTTSSANFSARCKRDLENGMRLLDRSQLRLEKYLAIRRVSDPDGRLFVTLDGLPVITLQLMSALKEARIERKSFDEKYSVDSLRRFFAVNALAMESEVFEVARNMGTSVQMIQELLREAGHAGRLGR